MKKAKPKRLTISRETIRELAPDAEILVRGGVDTDWCPQEDHGRHVPVIL